MRRVLPLLLALTLGVSAAALLACGGRDHLVPSTTAAGLERQLDDVKDAIGRGACDSADTHLAQLTNAVANLPESVDAKLRDRLQGGITHLAKTAPTACANVDTVTESVPATTQLTEPPPDTQTLQQASPNPSTTTAEPPPETTPTPTPDQPTTPPDNGNGKDQGKGNGDKGSSGNGNDNGSGGVSAP